MYQDFKENKIRGRYVTFQMIKPILDNYKHWLIEEGRSVLNIPIPLYRIGNGEKKIFTGNTINRVLYVVCIP